VKPHPREGGSSGYPVWSREEQLEKSNAGEETAGTDVINLVVLLFAHPDATIDEMAAHICNEGGDLYSSQQISKRLKRLDITTKIASVEAYQAQAEAVQHRVFCPPAALIVILPIVGRMCTADAATADAAAVYDVEHSTAREGAIR
jgi:hypothetical protein